MALLSCAENEKKGQFSMIKTTRQKISLSILIIIIASITYYFWQPNDYGTLVIGQQTSLLKNPSLIGYLSTNPIPNEVLKNFASGERIKYVDVVYGKDFAAYKIISENQTGYVIYDSSLEVISEKPQ